MLEKITVLLDGLFEVLLKVLSGIITAIITVDTAMLMVLIIGMTEITKQGAKRYKGSRSLRNFEIRCVSLIYGALFGVGFLKTPYTQRVLQGLFYSILATALYWIGKRLFFEKYFPRVSKSLSGQGLKWKE